MIDKDIGLIIRFLDNELSDQDVEEFKARYGHDDEFTLEVNELSKICISLEAASKVSLKNMVGKPVLRRFLADRKESVSTKNLLKNKWSFRIAAVVIPLIALSIGFEIWVKPRLTNDDLYLAYFQKLQITDESRSFTGEQKTNFQILQKNIDNAVLETIDALSDPRDIYSFGLYCMEEQRFPEAVYAFRRVVGMQEKTYLESSEWYLGLCYLKLNDLENAKLVFTSVAASKDHIFRKESKALLRKLR